LLQQGPRLSRQRRFLRVYSIVIALRRKSEPDSRLLQRGLSLLQPHVEFGGFEDGDDLTFSRLTPQVDLDLAHTARALEPQSRVLSGGERSGRRARRGQPPGFGFRQLALLGGQTRRAASGSGDLRLAAAATAQQKQNR